MQHGYSNMGGVSPTIPNKTVIARSGTARISATWCFFIGFRSSCTNEGGVGQWEICSAVMEDLGISKWQTTFNAPRRRTSFQVSELQQWVISWTESISFDWTLDVSTNFWGPKLKYIYIYIYTFSVEMDKSFSMIRKLILVPFWPLWNCTSMMESSPTSSKWPIWNNKSLTILAAIYYPNLPSRSLGLVILVGSWPGCCRTPNIFWRKLSFFFSKSILDQIPLVSSLQVSPTLKKKQDDYQPE